MEIYLIGDPRVDFLIEMIEKGMVIHDRPETWIESPKSFLNIVHLYKIYIW